MATKQKPTDVQEEHPLSRLIPDKDKYGAENYISRYFAEVKDLDVLATAHSLRHNVLISGPTGPGKTSCVFAYAANKGLPVVTVACNGAAEPSHFVGSWQPQPDKSVDFVLGDVLLAIQYGGIIYLDEVNFLPPKIGAFLHGLLDKRRTVSLPQAQGSSVPSHIKAHPDCFVVGAYNPDYEGTRPLNKAFKNRFAFKLHFDYDPVVEKELLYSAKLLEFATKLRDRYALGDITTPISTNLLIEFEEFNEDSSLGFDFAALNFLNNFEEDEREVVKEVFVLYAKSIWEELNEGDFEESSAYAPFHKAQPAEQPQEQAVSNI